MWWNRQISWHRTLLWLFFLTVVQHGYAQASDFTIVSAIYGVAKSAADGSMVIAPQTDVSDTVGAVYAQYGCIAIPGQQWTFFAKDPAPGTAKVVQITISANGVQTTLPVIPEGSDFIYPANAAKGAQAMQELKDAMFKPNYTPPQQDEDIPVTLVSTSTSTSYASYGAFQPGQDFAAWQKFPTDTNGRTVITFQAKANHDINICLSTDQKVFDPADSTGNSFVVGIGDYGNSWSIIRNRFQSPDLCAVQNFNIDDPNAFASYWVILDEKVGRLQVGKGDVPGANVGMTYYAGPAMADGFKYLAFATYGDSNCTIKKYQIQALVGPSLHYAILGSSAGSWKESVLPQLGPNRGNSQATEEDWYQNHSNSFIASSLLPSISGSNPSYAKVTDEVQQLFAVGKGVCSGYDLTQALAAKHSQAGLGSTCELIYELYIPTYDGKSGYWLQDALPLDFLCKDDGSSAGFNFAALSMRINKGSGGMSITKATYGIFDGAGQPVSGQSKDVTPVAQSYCANDVGNGLIDIAAGMNSIFGDPAPGKIKTLRLIVQLAGVEFTLDAHENKRLTFAVSSLMAAGRQGTEIPLLNRQTSTLMVDLNFYTKGKVWVKNTRDGNQSGLGIPVQRFLGQHRGDFVPTEYSDTLKAMIANASSSVDVASSLWPYGVAPLRMQVVEAGGGSNYPETYYNPHAYDPTADINRVWEAREVSFYDVLPMALNKCIAEKGYIDFDAQRWNDFIDSTGNPEMEDFRDGSGFWFILRIDNSYDYFFTGYVSVPGNINCVFYPYRIQTSRYVNMGR